MTRQARNGGWAWLAAGLAGGALAGVLDVAAAILGGIGGLTGARAIRLLVLSVSLVGAAGVLAAAAVALAARATRAARLSGRAQAALAAVAAAPLLVHDAFAAFTGHLAASIPGHGILSVVMAAFGTVAVYLFAARYRRWLERDRTRAFALSLTAVAVAAAFANRSVLPRLYPWFHETLSVVTVAACCPRPTPDGPKSRRIKVVAAAALVGPLAWSRPSSPCGLAR